MARASRAEIRDRRSSRRSRRSRVHCDGVPLLRIPRWTRPNPCLAPRGAPARSDAVKVVLLDTTELTPLQDIPSLKTSEMRVDGGVVAKVDVPVTFNQGRHEFDFPEAMDPVPPFL